jgi:hypothetical protein
MELRGANAPLLLEIQMTRKELGACDGLYEMRRIKAITTRRTWVQRDTKMPPQVSVILGRGVISVNSPRV